MRNLLVFVLAVLLGGALFFGLMRARRKTEALPPGAPAPSAGAEAKRDEPARPARAPAPGREPEHSKEAPPPAPLPSEYSGSLVVLDEQGSEHAQPSGRLALGLGPTGARTHHEVEVRDGRWSLTLAAPPPAHSTLELRACVLDGETAGLAPGQAAELALPSDGRLDLRLAASSTPLLHVRARDTGAELTDVVLYELPPAQRGSTLDALHPGPGAKAQARAVGASPVRLAPVAGGALDARVVFAHAPGHAWGRIEVEPLAGGERTLELDRAAALELAIVCDPADTALEIVLLETVSRAEALVLQRGQAESFVLEDLRPGSYVAEARHSGLLIGSVEVALAAGARTKAVLTAGAPPAGSVPFEGVLVVPEAWALEDFILEFLLQGRFDEGSLTSGGFEIRRSEMTLEPGSRERYRWRAPNASGVHSARYRVSLHPVPFVTEIDTGPSGTKEALIQVPAPAVVSVRVFDALGGAPVTSEKLFFAALAPRALVTTPQRNSAAPELRVPTGMLLLLTRPGQYEPSARLIEVGPGTNEVWLPARKKP